jgi:hypothetical protein
MTISKKETKYYTYTVPFKQGTVTFVSNEDKEKELREFLSVFMITKVNNTSGVVPEKEPLRLPEKEPLRLSYKDPAKYYGLLSQTSLKRFMKVKEYLRVLGKDVDCEFDIREYISFVQSATNHVISFSSANQELAALHESNYIRRLRREKRLWIYKLTDVSPVTRSTNLEEKKVKEGVFK